jgi:glycosyltransferase involved in cell wall biosynthesis
LLQGLQIANSQGARHSLAIAGRGPEEGALRRCARELGLAHDVAFVGAVDDESRARLLGNADIFVLASHSEGLPYALLEAMAAGVPVIATPVGAVPDVVADTVHGLLVAPGDARGIARALMQLADNHELLARMGAACRTRIAAAYSIERLADDFGQLYAELLAVRPSRIAPGN